MPCAQRSMEAIGENIVLKCGGGSFPAFTDLIFLGTSRLQSQAAFENGAKWLVEGAKPLFILVGKCPGRLLIQ